MAEGSLPAIPRGHRATDLEVASRLLASPEMMGEPRGRGGGEGAIDSLAFGALVVFFALMYAAPSEMLEPLAPLRPALIASTAALVLLVVSRLGRGKPISLDGWRGSALLLFTLLTLASFGWSLNPEGSKALGVECLKYAGIYFTVINLARTPRRLAILCGALVIASLVTSVGVMRWYFAGEGLVEGYRARWLGIFADPNRMAMTLGLVVPVALGFAVRRETRLPMRLVAVAALGLAVGAIVVSFSRGGFAGLLVGTAVWLLLERRFDRAALVGAAALLLLVLAPGSFWSRTGTVSTFREDASAMGRVHAWTVASRISADRPLLGVGAGGFRVAWTQYAPPEARRAFEAHNVFLQIIAELGWVGLFLYLCFIGAGVEGGVRAGRDKGVGWMARALVASAAGYLVCSVSAGFIGGSPYFYALFAMAAAAERLSSGAGVRAAAVPVPSWEALPPGAKLKGA